MESVGIDNASWVWVWVCVGGTILSVGVSLYSDTCWFKKPMQATWKEWRNYSGQKMRGERAPLHPPADNNLLINDKTITNMLHQMQDFTKYFCK